MLISQLLADLAERGAELLPNGDKLRVRGDELLTNADRAEIRANRAALLAVVQLRAGTVYRWPSRHIVCSAAHSRLWRAAIDACPGDTVTIEGDISPRTVVIRGKAYATRFDAGRAYRDGYALENQMGEAA